MPFCSTGRECTEHRLAPWKFCEKQEICLLGEDAAHGEVEKGQVIDRPGYRQNLCSVCNNPTDGSMDSYLPAGVGCRGGCTVRHSIQDLLPFLFLQENLAVDRVLPGYRLDLGLFDQNLLFFSQEQEFWSLLSVSQSSLGLVNGPVLKDVERLAMSATTLPCDRKCKCQGGPGLTSSFL